MAFSYNRLWKLLIDRGMTRTEEMDGKYKNPDNDPQGAWTSGDAFAADGAGHQGMVYAIQHPFTGELIYPYASAHWRYGKMKCWRQ